MFANNEVLTRCRHFFLCLIVGLSRAVLIAMSLPERSLSHVFHPCFCLSSSTSCSLHVATNALVDNLMSPIHQMPTELLQWILYSISLETILLSVGDNDPVEVAGL